MRVPRIYTSEALSANSRLRLEGKSGHYLTRVLRKSQGEPVRLFNGRGGEFTATVASTLRGAVELDVQDHHPVERESPLKCHLGLVASKGDRMDWAIQKCTELGVSAVTPLLSERSALRITDDRMAKKKDHWKQIAISACEQSGRNRIPAIGSIRSLQEWLQDVDADLSLVFTAEGDINKLPGSARPSSLDLLIGPEGGLTPSEITLAEQFGFQRASLGPRTLRTETAPVVAISLVQYLWGDLA